jgi:hypothetical protein
MLSGSSRNETRNLLSALAGAAERTYDQAAQALLDIFAGERFRGCCTALILVQVRTASRRRCIARPSPQRRQPPLRRAPPADIAPPAPPPAGPIPAAAATAARRLVQHLQVLQQRAARQQPLHRLLRGGGQSEQQQPRRAAARQGILQLASAAPASAAPAPAAASARSPLPAAAPLRARPVWRPPPPEQAAAVQVLTAPRDTAAQAVASPAVAPLEKGFLLQLLHQGSLEEVRACCAATCCCCCCCRAGPSTAPAPPGCRPAGVPDLCTSSRLLLQLGPQQIQQHVAAVDYNTLLQGVDLAGLAESWANRWAARSGALAQGALPWRDGSPLLRAAAAVGKHRFQGRLAWRRLTLPACPRLPQGRPAARGELLLQGGGGGGGGGSSSRRASRRASSSSRGAASRRLGRQQQARWRAAARRKDRQEGRGGSQGAGSGGGRTAAA